MVRLMKRRKRPPRASVEKSRPRGFDYGCLPSMMAVASLEFNGNLSAASVHAVAYGSAWSEAVNQEVPAISLVARSGDHLAKAFEEFNAWSDMTDPDSVEITFVFRETGEYVLAISPEYTRLQRRCLGFDRAHRAMAFGATWIKPVNSIHPLLRRFREHCSKPIAPFLFGGATYVGPQSVLSPSAPSELCPIHGLQPLLKFEVEFIDEGDVRPNSTGWLALEASEAGSQQIPESPQGPPKPEPDDIARQRVKTLGFHFHVTLERIRRSQAVARLMKELAPHGVRQWQIEQAVCNLVLSAEMNRGAHYAGLSARKAERTIIQAIASRFELADGGDIQTFTFEDVNTQVVADANALLRFLGKTTRKDLPGTQAALQSASVLEVAPAIDPPANWSMSS